MGAPRTCILMITIHLIAMATSQEVVKRVPQGFVGMRGKKYDGESTEQFYKRRPQFFVGVKGKKSYDLESPEFSYKRAPMGFMGVRGKKEDYQEPEFYPESMEYFNKRDGSLFGQIDYSSNEVQNANEFPFLADLLTEYLNKLQKLEPQSSESNERITNEVEKRAASIHQFFGVRGKKSLPEKRPYDLSFRGKFIGVRGKKDLKNSGDAQEIRFLVDSHAPLPKRKGQMGFIGMRGKKWIDESSSEMETSN